MTADEIIIFAFLVVILITTPIVLWFKSKEDQEDDYIGTKKRKQ